MEGIEPSTSVLSGQRSTTELHAHIVRGQDPSGTAVLSTGHCSVLPLNYTPKNGKKNQAIRVFRILLLYFRKFNIILMNIEIIYQNKDFIVFNKPPGLLVHGAPYMKAGEPTLTKWLVKKFPEVKSVGDDPKWRPGIVHRLDKETSGALLVCLNQASFDYFKNLFASKKIKKTYLAVVNGSFKEKRGMIDKPLGIKSGTIKRTVHSSKMAKEAVTKYEVIKEFEKNGQKFSLLKVFPLTGRTHQIRVHLNSINRPVAGDKLYGGKNNAKLAPRLMLHALSLEFVGADKKIYKIETPPPSDFLIDFKNLL